MKKYSIVHIAVFLIIANTLSAQEVLRLNDALKIGLENGYAIRMAQNDMQIATNNNSYGNAGFFPKLDATIGGNFRNTNEETTLLDGSTKTNSPSTVTGTAGLSLSWTLFDGMRMFVEKEKLDLVRNISEVELRVNIENTTAQIIILYNAINLQKQLVNVFSEAMKISEKRVEIARKAKNIGSGSDVALLKAEVDYKTDSSNMVQQQLYLQNYKADLNQTMGRDPSLDFEIEPIPFESDLLSFASIQQKALEQNPKLVATRYQQSISELSIKEARSFQLPQISLNSSYTINQYNYSNGTNDKLSTHGPYIGFTAGITLFNGFNVKRNIKNARFLQNNALLQTQQAEQAIRTDILKVYNTYQTSNSLVIIEKKALALAKRNLDIAIRAYEVGSISDIEMRDTQKNYIDVSYRLLNAQISLKNAEVELKRISGLLIYQ